MIELSLSAFAWTGVVLLQAVVHYTVRTQKRKMGAGGFSRHHHDDDDDQPALDASPLVLDLAALRPADEHEEGLLRSRPRALPDAAAAAAASSSHAVSGELFQDEIDPLDGDEPPVFFELLSQTGCEMMRVCATLD
jgi:hypothetical protein